MASTLIGFHKCPFCGSKTHVKVKDEAGKKAYSHCLDEFDKGCSHTGHATTATQDKLLRAAMRQIAGGGVTPSATPTAAATDSAKAPAAAAATDTDSQATETPSAPAKRRGLFY